MIKVGITGGIGSGKSTVCKVLEVMNIPVYYADNRAKALMEEDKSVRNQIRSHFGNAIYTSGMLNRKKLAEIVFQNPEELKKLNSIVHPAVANDFIRWTEMQHNAELVAKEAALLFESGSWKQLDYIITVLAPSELRIKRICKRDNTSREEVLQRMKNQWNDEEKARLSHATIHNNDKQLVIPQVIEAIQRLKKRPIA